MKTSELLKKYINPLQYATIADCLRGEEKEHFKEIISDLKITLENMPVTYETDGQGDKAIAHLHYFYGGYDWYITELDTDHKEEQYQAFGLVSTDCLELGYISINELISNKIELDLYWTPKTIGEIKKELS
jgi:hypothetical protein